MDHTFGRRGRPWDVVQHHWVPLTLRSPPLEPTVAILHHALVCGGKTNGGRWGNVIIVVVGDKDKNLRFELERKQGNDFKDKRETRLVHEDELWFAMVEEYGVCVGVEASVDGAKNGTKHWHCKMELVRGGNIEDHD